MRVRFWGTRGSIAKAGPTTLRYGGNTSCIEVRSAAGTIVMLDCGTGAHDFGQSLLAEGLKPCSGHILVSHTHWDHIQGIPFFAPFFIYGNEWHIYGPRGLGQSLREVLAGQMEYTYFPVSLDQLAAAIHYHDVVEGTFEIGDVRVTTRYLNHPALTMGYRLEADGAVFVYSSDHEPYSHAAALGTSPVVSSEEEAHRLFVQNADLLVHDAQYTAAEYPQKAGWGHSTIEYVTDLALACGVKRVALHHHDPMRTDEAVDRLVAAARQRVADAAGTLVLDGASEGEVIEIEGTAAPPTRAPAVPATGLLRPSGDLSDESIVIAFASEAEQALLAAGATADKVAVTTTTSGAELIEAVGRAWPSMIFLGDDLADAPALELCRRIRDMSHPKATDTPVIVVADQARVDVASGEACGVTDWLVRPFSLQYVRTRTRAWLLRTMCRWQKAALPDDEEERLRALRALNILDSPAEERFDRHTRIAAAALETPIALISLIDSDRQWFKSRLGVDANETPRDMAFCAHAIHGEEVFVVIDALHDGRFADNPLVAADPRIRFYAGVPLCVADGRRIGTLCVIDYKPRDLGSAQVDLLKDLARLVEREFDAEHS